MKMTFDEYINNPMGRKNAVYSNRHVYRELYSKKLDLILVREVGKVNYFLYNTKDKYYVHMKIPSEVIKNFYYDTVIEFYTDDKSIQLSKTLKDYYVKFYSNDPSFVFTFAHAMLENDMFIRDLVPRMSKEAILKVAKEKNAKNEIGYVKSIYFAYLLMRNYGLFNKIKFVSEAHKYDKKTLLKNIEKADIKVEQRQQAQLEYNKQKKEEKRKLKKGKSHDNIYKDDSIKSKISTKINTVKKVGKTKTINTIKKIKKI